MPIIKSAKKRVRQETVRRARNTAFKSQLKTEVKALQTAVDGGKKPEIDKQLSVVYSSIDKAVKKNIYHKNKAAHKKAQAAKLVKESSAKTPTKSVTKKPTAKKAPAKKVTKE